MFLIDSSDLREERLVAIYIPKSFVVVSKFPAFVPQRAFLVQLLKIQRARLSKENRERDDILEITKDNKVYQIEETKLYDFYIRIALHHCPILQSRFILATDIFSCEFQLKFSSSEIWLNYFMRNSLLEKHFSIFTLSNNLFEVLIFNQPIYNIFKIIIYIILEYQIIFVSRKPAGITLFCQSIIELIRPLEWQGLLIPFLRQNTFDFQRSKIPYIIGLDRNIYEISEKPLPKDVRRIIYDIDDSRFISKPQEEPKCPRMHQNFLVRKLNIVLADLKFYENDYFEEGILRYRQCFYNFILLMLNDIYKYFNTDSLCDDHKKVVLFDYKKFLSSFDISDQPFFLQFIKTQVFQIFVKELYKAIQLRDEYASEQSQRQVDYNFSTVLQFFDDMRFLSIRFGQQTLDDKFTQLENLQTKYIKDIIERGTKDSKIKVIKSVTSDFLPSYLENMRGNTNISTEMIKNLAVASFEAQLPPLIDNAEAGGEQSGNLSKSIKSLKSKNSIKSLKFEQEKKVNSNINKIQEPSIGGAHRESSNHSQVSQKSKDFSQMSSNLSNENENQKDQSQNKNVQQNLNVDENLIWDNGSVLSSHISSDREQHKINHMNLTSKKNAFRKKVMQEDDQIEECSEGIENEDEVCNLIVTNLADKNLLFVNEPLQQEQNQSLAGKSYFNKSFFSMNPYVGDDRNPEIHNKTIILMNRNQNFI